jgi:hypothetical protein
MPELDPKSRDLSTTLAGGGAGLALLATVRWDLVPMGELVKIGVAILLMIAGYLMYHGKPSPPSPPPPPTVTA